MNIEKPLLVWDLESTGTAPAIDRIVEIAMIKLHPNGEREEKEMRLNPTVPIPKEASDVHGLTNEILKDCPTFKQISKSLYAFIQGCDMATFNGNRFDIPMLYAEFERAGILWEWRGSRFIDACVIFKRMEERTLEAALNKYCGKELEGAHGAMADTRATLDVLEDQLETYEGLPMDFNELHTFCNYDKDVADIGGCFEIDDSGEFVFAFGKHKGKLAKSERGYVEWMLKDGSGFSGDTKLICKQVLSKK